MEHKKQALVDYLLLHGKDKSWRELADQFGWVSESGPRNTWKRYQRNKNPRTITTTDLSIEEEDRAQTERYTDSENIKLTVFYPSEPSPDQIERDHNIDKERWYLHSCYTKSSSKGWAVTAHFKLKTPEQLMQEDLLQALRKHTPKKYIVDSIIPDPLCEQDGFLVINIQDPHYNKLDITRETDNKEHMQVVYNNILHTLAQAQKLYNITKVYYIIGSDHYNSEWTGMTVKGTPQSNNSLYTEGFISICDNETKIISSLSSLVPEVEVVYCGGNHDQYVSWHMVKYLEAIFRKDTNINFDSDMVYTKYHRRGKTVFCTNHGDAQKPEKLAQNFPHEFKEWSETNHRYILTGDKHNELSKSIGGIEWYQIPALSPHKSDWDLKNGFTTAPVRLTSFLFTEEEGLKNIFKESI